MREICEAFDLMAEAKADMKGLTGHDRDVLVRDEREDLAKRCSNAIRALEAPSRRGADPAARDKTDERWRRRDAGPGDRDPGRPRPAKAAVAREYGMRLDQAARLERASASLARGAARCAGADYERAPASVRRAAEAVAREAAASPRREGNLRARRPDLGRNGTPAPGGFGRDQGRGGFVARPRGIPKGRRPMRAKAAPSAPMRTPPARCRR